jgi:hypothetical protein
MAHGRRRGACALGALLLTVGAIGACGSHAGSKAGPSVDGGGNEGETGGPGADATKGDGGCVSSSEPEPYVSGAIGTVTGSSAQASVCNASTYLFPTSPGQYALFLDSSTVGTVMFQSPAGAHEGLLTGTLWVGSPSPGVYASSDSASCGSLSFSYLLTVPAGFQCEGGSGAECAAEGSYGASAPSDCAGGTRTVAGSWTVTLTSVVPLAGDGGSSYFVTHGTVTATLADEADEEGGTDTETLTLQF